MVLRNSSTDDPPRGRQSRQEPSACPRSARADAGASSRTQRRPCHRGEPDRGGQARPARLDLGAAGKSGKRLTGRPSALTIRGRSPSLRERPKIRPPNGTPLGVLHDLHARTNGRDCCDLHPAHPLSPVGSQRCVVEASFDSPCKTTRTGSLRRTYDHAGSSRPRRGRRNGQVRPVGSGRAGCRDRGRSLACPTFLASFTPLVLTTRPVPGPKRAAEDRPVSLRAYFVLNTCRSGTTELTDAIFILAHPLSPVRPGGSPGQKGEG